MKCVCYLQAPSRNHPLLLLSGVGTNAIGYDLSPGVIILLLLIFFGHNCGVCIKCEETLMPFPCCNSVFTVCLCLAICWCWLRITFHMFLICLNLVLRFNYYRNSDGLNKVSELFLLGLIEFS